MITLTRRMSVVRCPSTDRKPMIRISNKFLENFDFRISDSIEINYQLGKITIVKLQNQHDYKLQKPCPVANSTANSSGGKNAPERLLCV